MAETRVVSSHHESVGSWLSRIVTFVFGVIELLILVRFALAVLGANAQSAFVQWVRQASDVVMAPFVAIFRTQTVQGATFEWSALVAIAVYALVAWVLIALIRALTPGPSSESVETVETTPVVGATPIVARRGFNWWRRA